MGDPVLSDALLAQLADAVAVVDADFRYRYASPRVAHLAGLPLDAVVGAVAWDVFPQAVGTEQHAATCRVLERGTSERTTWFLPRLGRWYEQRTLPFGAGLALVLIDDVSERERASARSERLVEIGELLAATTDEVEVNDVLRGHVLPLVGALDGTLTLIDRERRLMRAVGWADPGSGQRWTTYPITRRTPGTAAFRTGQPVFLSTLGEVAEQQPDVLHDMVAAGRRSVAALPLPLLADGRRLGSFVTTYAEERVLSSGERQFLTTAAALAGQALVRASLLDAERRSIRALQRSLLPQGLPAVHGVSTAARYVASDSAAQVGGDWYDVIVLADGSVALVLGDVEGHDLEAAALMGMVRSATRAYALEGHPPAVVMARTNAFLTGLRLERLVTVSYAQLHAAERLVTTVSAGHLPVCLVSQDGVAGVVAAETGPPLGVHDDGQHWTETTSTLPTGAVLAIFTDGLVEVRGEDLGQGLERVRAALVAERGSSLDVVAEALLAARGENADDVALLVARLTAADDGVAHHVTRQLPATPASVPLARRFVRQVLAAWQVDGEVVHGAELVGSELVTNAARHSEDDLRLTLLLTTERLRVEVGDSSHRMPVRPDGEERPVSDEATSGRGLLLVEAVSSRWGVDTDGLSKVVWAELDL